MPEVTGIDKLFSIRPKKIFSRFRKFGTSQFARTHYGCDDLYFILTDFGISTFGIDKYANIILLSGIYRTDNVTGRTKFYREPYYITKNPRTETQQANRQKLADGVAAWKVLTPDEKNEYNIKAKGKHMSGYNLFLREYLLSH